MTTPYKLNADAVEKLATASPTPKEEDLARPVITPNTSTFAHVFSGSFPHIAEAVTKDNPITMSGVNTYCRDISAKLAPRHLVVRFTINDGWGSATIFDDCSALELTDPEYTMTARFPDAVYDTTHRQPEAPYEDVARQWGRFLARAKVVDFVGALWLMEERNPKLHPLLQQLHVGKSPSDVPLQLVRLVPDAEGSLPREALIPAARNVVVFGGHVQHGFAGSSVVQRVHLPSVERVTTVVSFHPDHPKAPVTLPILDYNPGGTSGETACRPKSVDGRYGAPNDRSGQLRHATLIFLPAKPVQEAPGQPPAIPCDFETSQADSWSPTPAQTYGERSYERYLWLVEGLANELRHPNVTVTLVGLEAVPNLWWSGFVQEGEDTRWPSDMIEEVRWHVCLVLEELCSRASSQWEANGFEPWRMAMRLHFKTLAQFKAETDADQFNLLTVRPVVGNASVGITHY